MISGLHHYALEVPDLEVAEGFLQDFGLETAEKDGSLVATCPGRDQEQVRFVRAPANDWDVPPHLWGAPPPETFLANREPQSLKPRTQS